jgi:hypothetical protein
MEKLNTDRVEWVALLFCLAFVLLLINLILRKRLREEYILIWLLVALVLIFFTVFRQQLDALAALAGVYYAPSLLFLIIFGGVLVYSLHLSVVLSKQAEQIKTLAQKIAIMEREMLSQEE